LYHLSPVAALDISIFRSSRDIIEDTAIHESSSGIDIEIEKLELSKTVPANVLLQSKDSIF
ncbi:MAG TPA: hypothetical protein VFG29_13950, partial [Syntrophales bacterium]|nr:hypothetical protein [Syntrophales bacterium]